MNRLGISALMGETRVFTVSQLNAQIKTLLETNYRFIWVKGEISNFRSPASGHFYFTLKDEKSQIRAVLFRSQQRSLRFKPEDGLEVLCQGRISVYEPRGEYQVIVEVMEPKGVGALQLAFEQLKKKLEAEGLFDEALKRPLPICPQRIAIITSSTGAAIRDILKVLQRSVYPVSIALFPVRVQGDEAAREIADAIAAANDLSDRFQWDIVLVGRGGGSIEDLWAFNEEIVARAIVASAIPIISAVGHEIDFTISDLAADMRAPTPTAAAEWIIARLESFDRQLLQHLNSLQQIIRRKLDSHRQLLQFLEKRLIDPRRRLEDLHLLVDDRFDRLVMAVSRLLKKLQADTRHAKEKLFYHNPQKEIKQQRSLLTQKARMLVFNHRKILDRCHFELDKNAARLDSLSPLAVLSRGYSITYRLPSKRILRHSAEVQAGENVRVQLSKGLIDCTVRKIKE